MATRNRNASWIGAVALGLVAALAAQLGGADEEPASKGDADDSKLAQLFGDIAKNMDLIEQMLKKNESGAATQGRQAEVSRDLDKLIEELKKRQCSMQSGSGGGGQEEQQQKKKGGKGEKSQGAEKKQRSGESSPDRKPQDPKGGEKDPKKEMGNGKVPNILRELEKPPPSGIAGPLNEQRGSSGWGFLPGEVQALLDAERRSGVPAKYAELIRRYFERLAEGGADAK